MSKAIKEAAKQYAEIETINPWRNFKEELPKPNSHILIKMARPDYQAYGEVTYYADFWGEDRPDKWEQGNDRVVYEWQYINE